MGEGAAGVLQGAGDRARPKCNVPKVQYAVRDVFMSADLKYMQRALELAATARGRTSPNPMVGCVVVRDGAVIGEGFHARAGDPHAEVIALRAAGDTLADATLYVSLEPCAHQGRTPPCTGLLLEKRPARVVVAMQDPNPKVAGKGVAILRDAGIAVDVGILETEARRLNEWYIKHITTGRPFVIAKCAMTLDGKLATRTGQSKWITGETARRHVHHLRSEIDAILVGDRTVAMDDPSLTARPEAPAAKQPVRIVLSKGHALNLDRKIFAANGGGPTWLALPQGIKVDGAGEILPLPADDTGAVEIKALMDELGKRDILSLLIEGGGETLASAFEAGVVDKVMFYVAPKILGGRHAITAVEGEGAATLDDAIELEQLTTTALGDDLLVEAYVKKV
jgi:diaminohydroxyphosphoribosylaminopyrimidine deaminase / 5-amino-6-(5-phosphoribosylamino)uracil reductase